MNTRTYQHHYLSLIILALFLTTFVKTAEAAACINNNWQPTFVHDLDIPDGPWYVTPAKNFSKLSIVDNWDWTPHACDFIKRSGVRNYNGYTNCQQYTRVQCGCKRGVSEGNSTCENFLSGHTRRIETLAYSPGNRLGGGGMVPFPSPQPIHKRCPTRNPGQKTWYKFPANNNDTYLTCSYFKDGALRTEIPYVNRKKQGIEFEYKSESRHRLGFKTMYQNGKMHGVREQWTIDRKTGRHYLGYRTRYANGKKVGIHCAYKSNGSINFWSDTTNLQNRCFTSQQPYCADRCRNY